MEEHSTERPSEALLCVRCGTEVDGPADRYEVFERMHWSCFHLEYEHGDAGADRACGDPSCPNRLSR